MLECSHQSFHLHRASITWPQRLCKDGRWHGGARLSTLHQPSLPQHHHQPPLTPLLSSILHFCTRAKDILSSLCEWKPHDSTWKKKKKREGHSHACAGCWCNCTRRFFIESIYLFGGCSRGWWRAVRLCMKKKKTMTAMETSRVRDTDISLAALL